MSVMWNQIKKRIPTKRKIMQLYFALLFNANLKGFITGNIYQGNSKIMCAPGINCYSCPGAIGACPLGTLQGAFSAKHHSTIWYVAGILLLYCIMFGRLICGWLCPFGLIQELFYKIKSPKLKKSPVTRLLSWLKYVILVFFVFIIPIMYGFRNTPLPAFCKYICPAGTLEGGIGLLSNAVNESYFRMLGPLFTWKFLLLVSIMVGCIFVFRLFCRFICPLGALYGLFNKFSFFGIKLNRSKCVDCGKCYATCKVDIKHVGDQECISCGACVDVCPTQAITWSGPKVLLKANESVKQAPGKKRLVVRIISAVVMLAILVGTLGYYWAQEDVRNIKPAGLSPDEGNTAGATCYTFELEIIDQNGKTGEILKPNATEKVTIINFWGTWCGPCVAELPYFEQIAKEYGEDVVVVAIHSALLQETAVDYIKTNYPYAAMLFACDKGDATTLAGEYFTLLGGRDAYPRTLILDQEGIILQVLDGSVTYDELKAAVDEQLAK